MRLSLLLPALFGLPSLGLLVSRQFPHLIIPVDADAPDRAYGTQLTAAITQQKYTEISFDIPSNDASYCQLNFFLNTNRLKGAPWSLWGQAPYKFNISSLPPTINKDLDTWNSRPQPLRTLATVTLTHGGNVTLTGGSVYPCSKGQVAQFLLHPASDDREFGLSWFELDYPASEGGPHGITFDMMK
ncbi:ubiquitin 3 binding protein But2 C-terminal domain-containing protein [Boeremia exigua]|uniref:ubiquitin 3 binding protein But2 C-terminal domain-containing protein n=1 Tax=Boeremia exigua TaxID=749465 RepID=UPI001E8EE1CF|nr:ubiquitin 3 binding protein But2 C-terminal domain-containing protein [Boeremia exigua]KAH6614320.1 ubiquitin 3 binding protein But2 C-terminal domain-containing protein [Boeremia exigua]